MPPKKNKGKTQRKQAQQNNPKAPVGYRWWNSNLLKMILSGVFYFASSMVAVYELINYFRSDVKTFTSLILPTFIFIAWLVILVQLFKRQNSYAYILLIFTVLGGMIGWIGWRSYNETQHKKVIVFVAQFDGPEKTYGLHDQIMEDLRQATKDYGDTIIIDGKETITAGQGSDFARDIGKKANADLVIWAWYKPTDDPNINLHIENLSTTEIDILNESEVYRPKVAINDLESFEIQRQLGSETSTLVVYLTGLLRYEAGDYQTAKVRFEQVANNEDISTYIVPYELFYKLGSTYHYLDEYQNAEKYLIRSIDLNPNFASTYIALAINYTFLDDYDKAIQNYNSAIDLEPNNPIHFVSRGNTQVIFKKYDLAIDDFGKAIDMGSGDAYVFGIRGYSYMAEGKFEDAIRDFDKAIELDASDIQFFMNRGKANLLLNRYGSSIRDFDSAIKIDSQNAEAYLSRAAVYDDMGKYEEAIRDINVAVRIDPLNVDAYVSRGTAFGKLGRYRKAIEDFDKAIELDPEYSPAYSNRGYAYYLLSEYERALIELDKSIELDSSNEEAYVNRALVFDHQGKYDLAIMDLNKAIELNCCDPNAYRNRGILYQKIGKSIEANEDFKKYEELTGLKP